jgi:hypothetical protein
MIGLAVPFMHYTKALLATWGIGIMCTLALIDAIEDIHCKNKNGGRSNV